MKWIVCQIGAREHYAVARALWQRGALAALVTDLWVPPSSLLRRLTDAESIAGRYALELADAPVFAPNLRMLIFALQARVGRWPLWKKILAENAVFQKEAAKIIFGSALGAERHVLFSYSYAAAIFGAGGPVCWNTPRFGKDQKPGSGSTPPSKLAACASPRSIWPTRSTGSTLLRPGTITSFRKNSGASPA